MFEKLLTKFDMLFFAEMKNDLKIAETCDLFSITSAQLGWCPQEPPNHSLEACQLKITYLVLQSFLLLFFAIVF